MPTIENVVVQHEDSAADARSAPVCGGGGGVATTVEFLAPTGDAPLLRYKRDGVADIAV